MSSAVLALAISTLLVPASDPPLADFARTPAPVGHEALLLDELAALLPAGLSTGRDAAGSLIVRCGTEATSAPRATAAGGSAPAPGEPTAREGDPVRLLIAVGVDEPGFVVSQIRDDGYLRVRTLGAPTPSGDFHLLREGRPARIWTDAGVRAGVMLVDSVHLRSPRPEVLGEEHLYLDVGADSPAGVAALGVALLDPVVQREVVALPGGPVAAPSLGRRAAALVMLRALRDVPEVARSPGLALAFVAQSTVGSGPLGRGGEAVLRQLAPDEVVVLDGAGGLDGPVRRAERTIEAQGSHWRRLELRVAYAGSPVEEASPDDVEALLRALLQEIVYSEARAGLPGGTPSAEGDRP